MMSAALALLPPAVACLAFFTLSESVRLARAHGHLPPGITTPPLSLAGIHAPEYYVFAGGLLSVVLLLALMESLRARVAAPWLALAAARGGAAAEALTATARGYFWFACAGLAAVGVVPLQGWGAAASLLHVGGSGVFFAFTLAHGRAVLSALSEPELGYLPTSRARAPALWWAQAAVLGSGFLSFIPAQLLHPGERGVDGGEALDINRGGVSQWWLVASLVAYLTLWGAGEFLLLGGSAPPKELPREEGDADEPPPLVHESQIEALRAAPPGAARAAAAAAAAAAVARSASPAAPPQK
jgi:hypothetical protein